MLFDNEVLCGEINNTPKANMIDEPSELQKTGNVQEPQPTVSDTMHQQEKADTTQATPEVVLQATTSMPPIASSVVRLNPALFPDQPSSGSTLPFTIANVDHMLKQYEIKVFYDVIKKKTRIILPGHTWSTDNSDNTAITHIISMAALNGLNTYKIAQFVEAIADQNLYNPVVSWISSKPWDGKDRITELYGTVNVREGYPEHLKKTLMYRWLVSAVAAMLKPYGFKARGVLTFQGAQGIGKTTFLSSLVDDPILRESVIKLDHHLDAHNKDSILTAITHWLVEIGELDSSFKRDVARLKGFLTSDADKIRRPYAMLASEYPRRTVFFASVNQNDFLIDQTGNSRWWVIPVTKINYQHGIDTQQLWAQVAHEYQQGATWWLTSEEEDLLEYCNRDHMTVSVIREKLLDHIDPENQHKVERTKMTATETLKMLGYEKPTNPQARECGGILREFFGDPKRIKGKDYWRIPLKVTNVVSIKNDDDDLY